jgi:transcriptional regulator of acetoin/glycerol metabolism
VPIDAFGHSTPSEPDTRSANDRYHLLIGQAVPVMENLYQQITNTRSMVILSDSNGLSCAPSAIPISSVRRTGRSATGVSWAEDQIGTNAVGTAIISGHRPSSTLPNTTSNATIS